MANFDKFGLIINVIKVALQLSTGHKSYIKKIL